MFIFSFTLLMYLFNQDVNDKFQSWLDQLFFEQLTINVSENEFFSWKGII